MATAMPQESRLTGWLHRQPDRMPAASTTRRRRQAACDGRGRCSVSIRPWLFFAGKRRFRLPALLMQQKDSIDGVVLSGAPAQQQHGAVISDAMGPRGSKISKQGRQAQLRRHPLHRRPGNVLGTAATALQCLRPTASWSRSPTRGPRTRNSRMKSKTWSTFPPQTVSGRARACGRREHATALCRLSVPRPLPAGHPEDFSMRLRVTRIHRKLPVVMAISMYTVCAFVHSDRWCGC